jgi:para-nitrobenzyl esterase
MKKFLIIIALLLVVAGGWFLLGRQQQVEPRIIQADEATARSIQQGEIVGFVDDHGAHAWLGIPYAQSPEGELRWKAPRDPASWTDRFEALSYSSACPQIGNMLSGTGSETFGQPVGDEDCLYMNIWSPAFEVAQVPNSTEALPVMLWIHGGGNSIGRSDSPTYNGSHLASRHEVIIVSINYRLGPLGWFANPALRSDDASAADNSGNYGTLDTIRALNWIQTNIAEFGGDPNNVTVFGESAGARNVLTLMASPLASGLYHRAIVQSGGFEVSDFNHAENYSDADQPGHEFSSREIINRLLIGDGQAADRDSAKELQESMTSTEIRDYLMAQTAGDLLMAYAQRSGGMLDMPQIFGDGYVLPLGSSNSDIFLSAEHYNVTPVILGTNRDELKLFMLMGDDSINRLFGIPWSFKDEEAYERDNRYGTDAWKVRGVDELASKLVETQGNTVFAYRWDWDEERSVLGFDMGKALGAAHGLEIAFIFGNFKSSFGLDIYDPHRIDDRNKLSDAMMSYWAEFAYNGNPGKGRSGNEVAWSHWQNGSDDADRLLVFDTESDRGIRMSPERSTLEQIKQQFLADTSYSQEEHCNAYQLMFRGAAFNQQEFENLGAAGCQ